MPANPQFPGPRIGRPAYPGTYLDRPRLYQQLGLWQEKRAILIHAPSGYGKSSLVSRWLDFCGHATDAAWLALDDEDVDPRRFLPRFVMALEQILPGAVALTQPILADSQVSGRRVLDRLYATYWDEQSPSALPADRHILVVLDDLHRVQSPEVDELLASVMEAGPLNLHLVLLTRHRTTLPIARLYAHGDILTLDSEALRFTPGEVDEYLQRHGLTQPSAAELAQLMTRTEGWVTALQLAVLAMPPRGGIADLFRSLHGQSDWVARYLVDEVLNRQTPEIRRFLLQTSILDGFNADLCAAVTRDDNAYTSLDVLLNNELFLIQMGERERWFRYHHLFQELLQDRLQVHVDADVVAGLHARAAQWLANAGDASAAVRHFLAAGMDTDAAALVESEMRARLLRDPYSAQTLLALLPHHAIAERPQLMLDRCRLAALFDDSSTLDLVQEAKRTLQAHAEEDPRAAKHHGEWCVLRCSGHYLRRDVAATTQAIAETLPFLEDLDDLHSGLFHFLRMHLHGLDGEWAEMEANAAIAVAAFAHIPFDSGLIAVQREVAKWMMYRGDGPAASRRFRELFDHLKQDSPLATRDLVFAYLGAYENSYWQNEMELAADYLHTATDLANQLHDPEMMLIVACFYRLPGRADAHNTATVPDRDIGDVLARISTETLSDLYVDCTVRCLVQAGRTDSAWATMQTRGMALQDIPVDHVSRKLLTYLRAAIADGVEALSVERALDDALRAAIDDADRFSQLHLLALQAWCLLRFKSAAAATPPLLAAEQLAMDTGYVQIILEIPQLVALLQELGSSFPLVAPELEHNTASDPIELADRERRVLELLAAGLSYEQIAEDMVISINTVRTHVRNLYRKLSANRRSQAVRQAIRRGLLAPRE